MLFSHRFHVHISPFLNSQYMIIAPKKIRPNQVFQVFASIYRMDYGQDFVEVYVSVIRNEVEYANTVLRFDRPSSRIMQLQVKIVG